MDATQGSQPSPRTKSPRTKTDAFPFHPSTITSTTHTHSTSTTSTERPRVTLPSYMDDPLGGGDLAPRPQGPPRPQDPQGRAPRNNPCSEESKPLIVRQRLPDEPRPDNVDTVYQVSSRPKGFLLMITNIEFDQLSTRKGAERDEANLANLFRKLGYRVESLRDRTLQEMRNQIGYFARRPDLARVDSMFVAIMSHGLGNSQGGTKILASNYVEGGEGLDCQWVVDQFNARECAGMRYKPKVFLFQLCRGDLVDCVTVGGEGKQNYPTVNTDGTVTSESCRLNDDVLQAHATAPGYLALRHSDKGSWFIQAICEVYAQYAREDDLETMHRKVDRLIKQCISDDPRKPAMQTPTYLNQGFKKFYFYPGQAPIHA